MAGGIRSERVSGTRRGQEVLDAAAKLFASRGYSDSSVQDIADELGILKGSLYHYIDSKEDLLFRLLDDTHTSVEMIRNDVAALEDLTPIERLREYFARQAAYMTRNLTTIAIYYQDINQLSAERRKQLNAKRNVQERFVIELIEQAQSAGEVDKSLSAPLTANFMFGSMISIYRWYRPADRFKAADVVSGVADFVTRSLRAGAASNS